MENALYPKIYYIENSNQELFICKEVCENKNHVLQEIYQHHGQKCSNNFMKSKAMIIQIDEKYINFFDILCCDVPWILKFGIEDGIKSETF